MAAKLDLQKTGKSILRNLEFMIFFVPVVERKSATRAIITPPESQNTLLTPGRLADTQPQRSTASTSTQPKTLQTSTATVSHNQVVWLL
jgi:hypothetical protein